MSNYILSPKIFLVWYKNDVSVYIYIYIRIYTNILDSLKSLKLKLIIKKNLLQEKNPKKSRRKKETISIVYFFNLSFVIIIFAF